MRQTAAVGCCGLAAVLFSLLVLSPGWGQYPYPPPPHPPQVVPPPLLFVKFAGPAGMKVTFYRGAAGQTAIAPFTVGLRPGFSYKVKLSDIPRFPDVTVYPTLEVRGTLILANKLRNADFPAALVFRDEDFAVVKAGAMVTKVVALERPDSALPLASNADDPVQIDVPANQNPLQESLWRGRALVLLHMGRRQLTEEELTAYGASGTVLMPGEKVLPLPRAYPCVPWDCYPVFDPIHGPPHPGEELTLWDGGDSGLPAGMTREGKLRGLDPSDTVAQYTDSRGKRHLSVSNRVGLCVPRFVIFRGETALASQLALLGPGGTSSVTTGQMVHSHIPPLAQHQNQQVLGMAGAQRPSSNIASSGTAIVGRIDGLSVSAAVQGTGTVQGTKEPPPATELPDKPLKIIKFPDKCGGLIGELITFTIRFSNVGGRPITNVVVSDSLTTRFEYVAGSSKSDRPATFTRQPNDAGSAVLRWEFPGALQAGESGTVTFQVRIR
jgi:uncharacterized repeat protein (TIGR01451 family)